MNAAVDLTAYRASERERERVSDLMALLPERGRRALDIGARDGHLSRLLAERFDEVVALDLEQPAIVHPRVTPVRGNAAALAFDDGAFDAVLCAEVLEHVPPTELNRVAAEIARVTGGCAVIGVPYRQDIRHGRTLCRHCGRRNPPWGHVNAFDERRLTTLFDGLSIDCTSYVGTTRERTNALSATLMDYAGNPYGTYEQEEGCVHCGHRLTTPAARSLPQKIATRAAHLLQRAQTRLARPRPNWIHVRFVPARRRVA